MIKFAASLLVFALASCANDDPTFTCDDLSPLHRAIIAARQAEARKAQATVQTPGQLPNPVASEDKKLTNLGLKNPSLANDLRAPGDMLNLPQDDQLKSSPTTPVKDANATLIAKPPE